MRLLQAGFSLGNAAFGFEFAGQSLGQLRRTRAGVEFTKNIPGLDKCTFALGFRDDRGCCFRQNFDLPVRLGLSTQQNRTVNFARLRAQGDHANGGNIGLVGFDGFGLHRFFCFPTPGESKQRVALKNKKIQRNNNQKGVDERNQTHSVFLLEFGANKSRPSRYEMGRRLCNFYTKLNSSV